MSHSLSSTRSAHGLTSQHILISCATHGTSASGSALLLWVYRAVVAPPFTVRKSTGGSHLWYSIFAQSSNLQYTTLLCVRFCTTAAMPNLHASWHQTDSAVAVTRHLSSSKGDASFTLCLLLCAVQTARYQRKLLQVAVQLLKPGGKLVFSTCTINPGIFKTG